MKIRIYVRSRWAAKCLAWYLKFVYRTTRWTFENKHILDDHSHQPRLFCFWHGRLAMMPFAWESSETFFMLLSQHGDGRFIGDILKCCGPFDLVYGSTNRGGMEAVRHVINLLKEGSPVGITPDGPRGPRETISHGTAILAYLSQAIVIPSSFSISRCLYLKSWDRFCLPFPFSSGHFSVGHPLPPPSHKHELDAWKKELKKRLDDLNEPHH